MNTDLRTRSVSAKNAKDALKCREHFERTQCGPQGDVFAGSKIEQPLYGWPAGRITGSNS